MVKLALFILMAVTVSYQVELHDLRSEIASQSQVNKEISANELLCLESLETSNYYEGE